LQHRSAMLLLEFAIIYLACGAPVAVYRLTDREDRSVSTMRRVGFALFLWPLEVANLVKGRSMSVTRPDRVDDIRSELERSIFTSRASAELFEFREVYACYTGLARAANAEPAVPASLLEVAHHPSRSLAIQCLKRRQSRMLARHRDGARAEFASLLAHHSTRELGDLVLELASALDDPVLSLEVARPAGHPSYSSSSPTVRV
jgi:hypothetical protein